MRFKVKHYSIQTDKLEHADKIAIVFLSDLHLAQFGKKNENLIWQIEQLQPDLIISGGDMVTGSEGFSTDVAVELLSALTRICPVYAALGNHEKRLKEKTERFGTIYQEYKDLLGKSGVCILDNTSQNVLIRGNNIRLHGLTLPLMHYRRFTRHDLPMNVMNECVGEAQKDCFNLLLAHHPRYASTYFAWGADLILSGHIHGGVIRFGQKALISPDFQMFPKYGYGRHTNNRQELLISAGLGEHTVPFRLFNPKELLYIEIKQEVSHGDSR